MRWFRPSQGRLTIATRYVSATGGRVAPGRQPHRQSSSWRKAAGVGVRKLIAKWPAVRQLGGDPYGLGAAAQSERSAGLTPRTDQADAVVASVCPYCAVGCGQKVYVQDGRITQIEG